MATQPIRGALIDIDGVLHIADRPLPGAAEALAELRQCGIKITLLTNGTMRTRQKLAENLCELGFQVTAAEIISAASATADYLRREYAGQPCHLLAAGEILPEFNDVPLTNNEQESRVVVIGGAGEAFTFEALNRVYRMLRNGAALVAMHKSVHWITGSGVTVDSGLYVHGLEWATGVQATVIGKPAEPFFQSGYRLLDLPPEEVVMISDDNVQDVLPSMRLGSRGVLVRIGVFEETHLEEGAPDATLDSIADLPELLDRWNHLPD